MKISHFIKNLCFLAVLLTVVLPLRAQVTGKYGTYYDQRELLFESLPTSKSDIIFLGNSITDYGAWDELFQNPCCKNRGISGDICEGVLNRLETITKGQPAMVFLLIGTNDMNWGYSNDTIAMNIRAIVRRIKEESPRTRIIVQSILPVNDCYGYFKGHTDRYRDVAVINGMVQAMAAEEGVEYLDLYSRFATEEGKLNPLYSLDGLHLNGEGYLLWKSIVEEEIGRLPRHPHRVPVWLELGTGSGIFRSFDAGASPMRYTGVGAVLNTGVTVEWSRFHVHTEVKGDAGILLNNAGAGTYDFGVDVKGEFLYKCYENKSRDLHLWAGAAIQSYVDIRSFPQLMNASIGVATFADLQAVGLVQYDFDPVHFGTHNLFSMYGKLSLPLVAGVGRPGFAYMDNYTSSLDMIETLLQDYEEFAMAFPGASTEVGIVLNLLNGNKIGYSYHWDYLTTRNRGTYRFDRSAHTFRLYFQFNLH